MTIMAQGRLLAQLRLALRGNCGCPDTLAAMTNEAREHGMTGAEIDTALSGRSFEARSSAAITYACAIRSGDPEAIASARVRASRMGLGEDDLYAVDAAARQILDGEGQ